MNFVYHFSSPFFQNAKNIINFSGESCCSYNSNLYADVASSKRHQRLNEILIFTRTKVEISKVVYKKSRIRNVCIFLTSESCMKRAIRIIASVCSVNRIASYYTTEFFKTTLRIPWCSAGKKNNEDFVQSLVAF